jgi:hypothetical protein
MLRWTAAGVVGWPTVLQVRVTEGFPSRLRAGAPQPSRGLSVAELRRNLAHFTAGMDGPRTRPVNGLVLSGALSGREEELAEVVRASREQGIARVTLHLDVGADSMASGPLGATADAVAVRVVTLPAASELASLVVAARWHVTAVVELTHEVLAELPALLAAVAEARPARAVLTWPLLGRRPPSAPEVVAALAGAVGPLQAAGVPTGVKGLPPCALARQGVDVPAWRSGNRWYVDADHQLGDALMFFPDVVRFAKADVCRFCGVADRCDGVPAAWLEAGLAGVLDPLP